MRKWRELVEHREVVVSEKTVACDQRGRIGMCEHVTELAGGNPGIDRDHRTAERADREVSNDPFGLVAHQDRDHLALSDSKCMQPFCERSDLLAQRRIGVPLPAPYKRLSLWETCRQLVEQAGDSTARRHRNHAENALFKPACLEIFPRVQEVPRSPKSICRAPPPPVCKPCNGFARAH